MKTWLKELSKDFDIAFPFGSWIWFLCPIAGNSRCRAHDANKVNQGKRVLMMFENLQRYGRLGIEIKPKLQGIMPEELSKSDLRQGFETQVS